VPCFPTSKKENEIGEPKLWSKVARVEGKKHQGGLNMRILERLLLGRMGRQLTITLEQLVWRALEEYKRKRISPISGAVRVYLAGRLPPELQPYKFLEMKTTKWGKIRAIAMPSEGEWMVVVWFIEEESE
jgi:hypothetical protein